MPDAARRGFHETENAHFFLLTGLLWTAVIADIHAAEAERLALIIGNGNYADAPLTNPSNDARDLAEVLKQFGFDVMLKTDVSANLSRRIKASRIKLLL